MSVFPPSFLTEPVQDWSFTALNRKKSFMKISCTWFYRNSMYLDSWLSDSCRLLFIFSKNSEKIDLNYGLRSFLSMETVFYTNITVDMLVI